MRPFCVWYLPSEETIGNGALCSHDLNFKGHILEILVSRKRWELSQNCVMTSSEVDIRHKFHHCKWCTPWPWPLLSRSNIFYICYKKFREHWMSPADLPRLARPPQSSCYCFLVVERIRYFCICPKSFHVKWQKAIASIQCYQLWIIEHSTGAYSMRISVDLF